MLFISLFETEVITDEEYISCMESSKKEIISEGKKLINVSLGYSVIRFPCINEKIPIHLCQIIPTVKVQSILVLWHFYQITQTKCSPF